MFIYMPTLNTNWFSLNIKLGHKRNQIRNNNLLPYLFSFSYSLLFCDSKRHRPNASKKALNAVYVSYVSMHDSYRMIASFYEYECLTLHKSLVI